MLRLRMNRMGYWLWGIYLHTAFSPSASDASPIALYITFWQAGLMRVFSALPTIDPVTMVHTFTIVPNIFFSLLE